jgi:hypothetical protein
VLGYLNFKKDTMILKWVEYKMICDRCSQDIIGWSGLETRKDLVDAYKLEFGKNPVSGGTICDDCKNDANRTSPEVPAALSDCIVVPISNFK